MFHGLMNNPVYLPADTSYISHITTSNMNPPKKIII